VSAQSGSLNLNDAIDALSNVFISNPILDEVLAFDTADSLWKNKANPAGGEANTSSNVGTGEGLALAKVGVDLPFKSLIGEANRIILTGNANDVTFTLGSEVVLNVQNNNFGAFFQDFGEIAVPANPAINVRRLFVDSATGELSVRTNAGATVSLEAGGGEVFTWSANHDANGFALEDARFADDIDNTKIIDLNLVGMTTGITAILDFNFTTAKTITFPDATTTMVGTGIANQLTDTELTSGVFAKITGLGVQSQTLDMGNNQLTMGTGLILFGTGESIGMEFNDMVFDITGGDEFLFDIGSVNQYTFTASQLLMQGNNLVMGSGVISFAANESIGIESGDMIFDIPTTDFFSFDIATVPEYQFDASALTMNNNNLIMGTGEITVTSGAVGDIFKHDATGFVRFARGTSLQVLRVNVGGTDLEYATIAAGGDMVLVDAQTNTGIKTFLDTTMKLRNVANTFDAFFVNTVTAERIYTLPDFAGTVLVSGNAQIVTGDISATAAIVETQLSVAVGGAGTVLTSNGVGVAPTYQAGGAGDMILASVQTSTGKKTFAADATLAGFNLNNQVPSAPVAGDIWRATDNLTYRNNAGSADIIISTDTNTLTLLNKTLTTPTIGDLSNMTHDHSNAAGGANLTNTALTSGVFAAITGIGVQTQTLDMAQQVIDFSTDGHTITAAATNLTIDASVATDSIILTTGGAQRFAVNSLGVSISQTLLLAQNNISWATDGHSIVPTATALTIDAGAATDTIDLQTGGVSRLLVNGSIDVTLATNNLILTAGFLQFSDVNTTITDAAGIMQYDVASTFSHDWRINNTIEAQLTATIMNLPNAVFQEAGVPISPIGLHDMYFDGGSFISVDAGTKAEVLIGTTTNRKGILAVPFATSVDTFATIKIIPPRNYNNGTITVVIHWTPETNGTGNVLWGVSAVAAGDGDDLTAVGLNYGSEIQPAADAGTNVGIEQITARTTAITIANTPADGDAIYLKVRRNGVSGSDTFTQGAHLLGISVEFSLDAAVAA